MSWILPKYFQKQSVLFIVTFHMSSVIDEGFKLYFMIRLRTVATILLNRYQE